MNERYVPYNVNGSWYVDDCFGKTRGPYVYEAVCQEAADVMREKDEAKGFL